VDEEGKRREAIAMLRRGIAIEAIAVSRTSPTELAVSLAAEAGVALCGYVRRGSLQIFHDPGRLLTGPSD